MPNAFSDYDARARQLLLPDAQRRAFVALNEHADALGTCPSCGDTVGRFESDRVTHARRCQLLLSDAAEASPAAAPVPTLTVSPGAQAAPTLAADLPAAAGADSPIAAALSVLVLDPRIRAYLASHDPQALRQAATALHGVGLRYQPADGPADLCWYCFLPLTRQQDGQTVCRDCRHAGRPVRPQQLEGEGDDPDEQYASEGDAGRGAVATTGERLGWACTSCHTSNGPDDRHCVNCGRRKPSLSW